MGSILQARGDRRLHRRKEFAQHCAGGVLLVTELGGDDDRRRIAGLAKQLGFAFPQFGKIVVGGGWVGVGGCGGGGCGVVGGGGGVGVGGGGWVWGGGVGGAGGVGGGLL